MATINGTNSGDSLYGTAAADIINGLNGNDTLKGFGGADRRSPAAYSLVGIGLVRPPWRSYRRCWYR